jgi:alpha-galactosidase
MLRAYTALALLLATDAGAAVRYLAAPKIWILETERTSYLIGVNELNEIQHVYFGNKLLRDADLTSVRTSAGYAFESREGMTPEEYPGWGGMRYFEPCLKVTTANGTRDLVLKYVSHEIRGEALDIRLQDIRYDLAVTLSYQVFPRYDIVRKQARIENRGLVGRPIQAADPLSAGPADLKGRLRAEMPAPHGMAVTVESAQSGVWYVPAGDGYRLSYLTGRWAGETQLMREPIQPGKKVLESRRGNTSHQANPWFAIDAQGAADEEHGRVWFGLLGWSGNWKFTVEQTANQQVRVTGGYNDFDFGYVLKPGEALETPPFYGGFTDHGFGETSRILHRFERAEILPDRAAPHPRPVLYNSWEATLFNVNEVGQTELARKAAKIGVELFVMDDGWFGQRNDDHAGLGDWFVNTKKFPNGLKGLIQAVNGLGMKFGLWVEPEMVNPNSDLYRAHPDWAIHFDDRPRTEGRNQLILNMARDEVRDHIFGVLDKLVSENNIAFLKWDMNRHFTEPGWPEAPPAEQKKIWVKYVTNVYDVIDRLRAKHPELEIESCSGGGGRVDLGIMRRVDEVWTSDNTEAFDRLRIQEGFSQAYTPKVMMAWVTDVPNMNNRTTPLKYRFLVSMQGSLGIGANLNKWTSEDFQLAADMVSNYKSIRETVQMGKLYRLYSPRQGDLTANQYVSEDGRQAVLFAFLHSQQMRRNAPTVYLRGLDAKATYRVKTIDKKLVESQRDLSGSYLMNQGLNFRLAGDFDSTMVIFEK